MMMMDVKTYRDKVRGCWLGKNIGGTLGAPFECRRGVFELEFYTQNLTDGAAPNDDLDLQLLWLNAAEKYGRGVDASVLGEYWLSYIVPDWSEYGAGKNNLRMGLLPPLSGWYNNHNRDSCGAFIRSEIWACLAPGRPETAAAYAYEDAIVDHSEEGVYGEVFFAAIESAAFAVSDREALIDIGLSFLPKDCGIARAVAVVRECRAAGLDWRAARKRLLQAVPGSFGTYFGYEDREPEPDVPAGKPGYDAPSNVGITVLGWVYGDGDFGRSLCIAAGCGEDGDCTAATLGSILGIIAGGDALPEKWTGPIGDGIKTICLDVTNPGISIPKTVTELTERVCALMPVFMGRHCDTMREGGTVLHLQSAEEMLPPARQAFGTFSDLSFAQKIQRQPLGIRMQNALMDVTVACIDGVDLTPEQPLRFHVHIINNLRRQQWLRCRLLMPQEWSCSAGREFAVNLDQPHGGFGMEEAAFSITPHTVSAADETVVLEISSVGRHSRLYIPIRLISTPQIFRK